MRGSVRGSVRDSVRVTGGGRWAAVVAGRVVAGGRTVDADLLEGVRLEALEAEDVQDADEGRLLGRRARRRRLRAARARRGRLGRGRGAAPARCAAVEERVDAPDDRVEHAAVDGLG